MNLYLLNYNNYYNRIVKKEDTLEQYIPYMTGSVITDVNFIPGDGINTTQIVNWIYEDPDYLVVTEGIDTIVSRWFVTETVRTRKDQLQLSLRRDLLVDFYNDVINAPCFIEKAMVDYSNKLIFNSEGVSFNQIKTKEELLKDETKCGWLVGYIANNWPGPLNIEVDTSGASYPTSPIDWNTLQSYGNAVGTKLSTSANVTGSVAYSKYAGKVWSIDFTEGNVISATIKDNPYEQSYQWRNNFKGANISLNEAATKIAQAAVSQQSSFAANIVSAIGNVDTKILTQDDFNKLYNMQNVIYQDGEHIFSISLTQTDAKTYMREDIPADGTNFPLMMDTIMDTANVAERISYAPHSGYSAKVTTTNYTLTINTNVVTKAKATITSSVRILQDAPYRMFAIPCGNITSYINSTNGTIISTNEKVAKTIANNIATQLGGSSGGFIYDLQYLPYCPKRSDVSEVGVILHGTEGIDYTLVKKQEESSESIVSYILWCTESSGHFQIKHEITVPTDSIEFKVENETSFCRLISPNYSGAFEFKPTMNYGIDGFEVNFTYMPFQPYIHINPIFKQNSLFGGDFNDQRGLVCSGSFSLPVVTDSWINYQIQNASYSDAFERQIQNMATNYNLNLQQQKIASGINAATSALGAGLPAGALGASMFGLPGGLVAGGLLGAATLAGSLIGRSKDLEFAAAAHTEAEDFARDMHSFQLANIQALPSTIGRVGVFNVNNKIFPFIEYYTCTDVEKDALREKIKYNGMTITAIGTVFDYITGDYTFISGSLIRIEDVKEDYHIVNAIANELYKGVFIKYGTNTI